LSKVKRILLLLIPGILLPIVYVLDVVRSMVEFEVTGLSVIRELIVIVSFFLIALFIEGRRRKNLYKAPKEIGRVLLAFAFVLVVMGLASLARFDIVRNQGALHIRQSALSIFGSSIIAILLGTTSLYLLFVGRDLVLSKRRKTTRRNYLVYLVVLLAASAATAPFFPFDGGLVASLLFTLTIAMIIVISFRQNWIVYLSKREKIYSIIYSVLLCIVLIILDIVLAQNSRLNEALLSYSHPLHTFIRLNAMYGTVYFGVTFVSTLFHMPTAEVFERKQSELNSLHNLSRLVTQVFDFNDLLSTVTMMTTEVCGARSVWLELFSVDDETGQITVEVVAKKNISTEDINLLSAGEGIQLQRYLFDTRKALLIEDLWSDRRTKHLKEKGFERGSLLTVPLLSHGRLIGVLHATKDFENPFEQDDIDVMTAFADHVSIAIENSRLIAKSLERERLHQEMMVAQRMQKRLLPQELPELDAVQFAAVSESSMEVGGDYFDVITLPDDRIGVIVGDVAGKGVSAAFYMAEVKGIFLSMSTVCTTPRELLLRANETLLQSLEKNVFISAVYALLDVRRSTLTLARAGHCPVIFLSGDSVELVKPTGLGLGLASGNLFEQSTEERLITLRPGDVCIFYTDGITEARNSAQEEYGYDRLTAAAKECKNCSATDIKDTILESVKTFIGKESYTDDVTLIVVKWLGKNTNIELSKRKTMSDEYQEGDHHE
jgi:sigma-B regulation protein RsbU (phosphoserine phosphatase)